MNVMALYYRRNNKNLKAIGHKAAFCNNQFISINIMNTWAHACMYNCFANLLATYESTKVRSRVNAFNQNKYMGLAKYI